MLLFVSIRSLSVTNQITHSKRAAVIRFLKRRKRARRAVKPGAGSNTRSIRYEPDTPKRLENWRVFLFFYLAIAFRF